jgi:hypothetical protein
MFLIVQIETVAMVLSILAATEDSICIVKVRR